jgi:hypothetical protein
MVENHKDADSPPEKVAITLEGTVEKVIPPIAPKEAEKVQISVKGAEPLYKEIRVDNTLHDEEGNPVSLKKGAEVEVTIEAEAKAATPKRP